MRIKRGAVSKIKGLRRRGRSIPEISTLLAIPKSTVHRYVRNVDVSIGYQERLLARRNASKIISQRNWDFARQKAKSRLGGLSEKELALIAVCLYWAEGAKRDFTFSNTDPRMVKVFITILKKVFDIKKERLQISLRIYEDLDKTKCLKFWSKVTGMVLDKNTSVNILKGMKSGKLQYGMCRVRLRKGGLLLKEFSAIIDRIIELMPL